MLAGGVGASRFLQGLYDIVEPGEITIISNTGDDTELAGLHVSPDIDIVVYALARASNPDTGWGLREDTFAVVDALQRYGYERWFNLGDRDLATALYRTHLLRDGARMHEVVAAITDAWNLGCTILPMTNERVDTRVIERGGRSLALQEYMVRERAAPEVESIAFEGVDRAHPAPGVIGALEQATAIVLAPSNPFVSVGPILAVPGVRKAILESSAPCVAVSPIIGGYAVKGPAADMLRSLGHEVSALGVARIYQGLVDVMVIDTEDAALQPEIETLGMRCVVTQTLMSNDDRKRALARDVLAAGVRH